MTYSLFLKNVQTSPNALCVETTWKQTYSYEQASLRVNAWANYLLEQGIEKADRVAVLLDNEDEHLFIALALDRINAQCVSFDRDIPLGQLQKDIEKLNFKKFIVDSALSDFIALIPPILQLSLSDEFWLNFKSFSSADPVCLYDASLEKIIYIVSSSGSTGEKKWIPIAAAGLLYWAKLEKEHCGFTASDKVLVTRSPAYDARFSEYVRSFSVGMPLRLISWKERKDFAFILSLCQQEKISCLLLIASQLGAQYHTIVTRLKEYGLKHLMVTGDACTLALKHLCEELDINLWNCYGPTEATFGLSILRVNGLRALNEAGEEIVPIGKPIAPMSYQIREGRLFIDSPFLTPAYVDEAPEKGFILEEGVRLFDTGDAFTETENGNFLVFGGRASFESHCKVEGVKVSSSLIENCLFNYNAAHQQALMEFVVVIKKHLTSFKPVAYLVLAEHFKKDMFLSYLRHHLKKEELPLLVALDHLPRLASSQKVDLKSLTERDDDFWDFFKEKTGCDDHWVDHKKTALKIKIQNICASVLKITRPLMHVNLNFLGLSSLTAAEIVTRIHQDIAVFSYQELLTLPELTIENISEALFKKMNTRSLTFFTPVDSRMALQPDVALLHTLVTVPDSQGNIFFLPALLGEGYFSYQELARLMGKKFSRQNIYGLTEPAIENSQLLPKNMSEAVARYLQTIQRKQAKGPYELLGFSFGATLAYEVALLLEQQGEKVTLHLVDGFPPYYYQALDNYQHALLMECIANFLIGVCNNSFYQEKVLALSLKEKSWPSQVSQMSQRMQVILASMIVPIRMKSVLQDFQEELFAVLLDIGPIALQQKIDTLKALFVAFKTGLVMQGFFADPVVRDSAKVWMSFLNQQEEFLLNFVKKYVAITSLEKKEQIKKIFHYLQSQLKNTATKKMLNVAKQHLLFILEAPTSQQKLSAVATLYLSNSEQPYAQAIHTIREVSPLCADKTFYFWNRYFSSLARCGVQLSGGHLKVIKPSDQEQRLGETAASYWPLEQVRLYYDLDKKGADRFGGDSFYSYQQNEERGQLNLFFLNASEAVFYQNWVELYNLQAKVVFYDKTIDKFWERQYKDTINFQKMNLFIEGPVANLNQILKQIKTSKIDGPDTPKTLVEKRNEKASCLDIEIIWNEKKYMTFSFKHFATKETIYELLEPWIEKYDTDLSCCLLQYAVTNPSNLWLRYDFFQQSTLQGASSHAERFVAAVTHRLQSYLEEPFLAPKISETPSLSCLKP